MECGSELISLASGNDMPVDAGNGKAGIRDIVGGRAGAYEKVLSEAKDTSMQEMIQRAQALGANAIVGIDIDYETVGANGSMLMVATSGTAVVI